MQKYTLIKSTIHTYQVCGTGSVSKTEATAPQCWKHPVSTAACSDAPHFRSHQFDIHGEPAQQDLELQLEFFSRIKNFYFGK